MNYQIKTANDLTKDEIKNILKLWDVPAWSTMNADYFRLFFKNSEFHFIKDHFSRLTAIIRLNFDFTLEISGKEYEFVEAVGLVSAEKGNGKKLIQLLRENISNRNLETIGFCNMDLRPFYEKCDVKILHDQAKIIKEKEGTDWITSEDDDILIFNADKEKNRITQSTS